MEHFSGSLAIPLASLAVRVALQVGPMAGLGLRLASFNRTIQTSNVHIYVNRGSQWIKMGVENFKNTNLQWGNCGQAVADFIKANPLPKDLSFKIAQQHSPFHHVFLESKFLNIDFAIASHLNPYLSLATKTQMNIQPHQYIFRPETHRKLMDIMNHAAKVGK
jgi:hypothetical protein